MVKARVERARSRRQEAQLAAKIKASEALAGELSTATGQLSVLQEEVVQLRGRLANVDQEGRQTMEVTAVTGVTGVLIGWRYG